MALVGGDVNLDGGKLTAPGGRIELGGLAGAGTLGLNVDSNNLSLSYPEQVQRASVSLTNGAEADVTAGGGGSIAVTAQNLDLMGGSTLRAGIRQDLGSVGSQAGNVEINSTGAVTASGSNIFNTVRSGAIGNSGDINVTTGSLFFTNGSQLSSATFGQGNAGSVTISAGNISFDGVGSSGFSSGAFSDVNREGVGKGGDINITTGSLFLTNGAQVGASTFGHGDAGNVTITAANISFDGVGSNGPRSGAYSSVEAKGVGNGGNINITTGSLSLTNGAELVASTRGKGDAGNLTIAARDTISFAESYALSSVQATGIGNGGDINITTGFLSLTNGAQVVASTLGQGNAGNVKIAASDTISFDGESAALSSVEATGVGKGGDINITTGSLSLTDGAQVVAATRGHGDAGNVTIAARDTISFNGVSSSFGSGAYSTVQFDAVGNGGDINIITGSLSVANGAQVAASTLGQGNAGNVKIAARDTISFDGVSSNGLNSAAFSTVEATGVGKGGDINITTGSLSVTNGAGLTASSEGNGAAGNIEVVADSIRLDNQGELTADTTGGQGNIILRSEDLVLRRGSNITTNATGTATGGNITIDTGVIAALENSDITANADEASGGQVRINAQGIFGTEFRETENPSTSDITATSDLGPQFSGTVDLNQGLITLPVELVNVEGLIANSCIVRSSEQGGSFNITGAGGLPTRPGDSSVSPYPTGTVRSISDNDASSSSSQTSSVPSTDEARRWKMGDPIVEPQGVYRLANGELVMSRECPH